MKQVIYNYRRNKAFKKLKALLLETVKTNPNVEEERPDFTQLMISHAMWKHHVIFTTTQVKELRRIGGAK